MRAGRVDWQEVRAEVAEALAEFSRQGVRPTLRSVFYWLVSRQVIPNTKSAYKALSRHMVKWRQEGVFPWDCLADTTREVLGWLSDAPLRPKELGAWIREAKRRIKELTLDDIAREVFGYRMPSFTFGTWANQPVVPLLAIEKAALAETVRRWTEDMKVPVVVFRGYSSWTFLYHLVEKVQEMLADHQRVVVLYLGDLDPSGVDIERFIGEAFEFFGVSEEEVELKRLAITPEQVKKYGLPPRPEDAETLAKLQRDPRTAGYTYDYVVELDALLAYAPAEFKELVRKAVLDIWDYGIYTDLKEKAEKLREAARRCYELLRADLAEKLKEIA